MRVLTVIDSLVAGGAETSLATMAPGLVAGGVELHVAYFLERDGVAGALEDAGARLHPLTGHRVRAARARAVRDLCRDLRPDLVHTTLFEADLAGRTGARWAGVPVVSSLVNDQYGPEHRADPQVRAARLLLARWSDAATARVVRRFHSVSHTVAEVMAPRLHLRPDRIDVVPRGRDPGRFGPPTADARRRTRDALGVGDGDALLLAVGRQEHQKGFDTLVRALAEVRLRHPRARLVVAGRRGSASDRLDAAIADLGLGEAVTLLGARDDVPDLLGAADVFVFPTRREGIGGAAIEAMATATPVVASDLPVLREVTSTPDGPAALLAPVDSPTAFAAAIGSVLDDPVATAARVERGRARFLADFTIDAAVRGMLGFYERALRGASG